MKVIEIFLILGLPRASGARLDGDDSFLGLICLARDGARTLTVRTMVHVSDEHVFYPLKDDATLM